MHRRQNLLHAVKKSTREVIGERESVTLVKGNEKGDGKTSFFSGNRVVIN